MLKLAKINLGNMSVHSSDEDATVFVNPSSVCSDSSLDEVSDSKWGGEVTRVTKNKNAFPRNVKDWSCTKVGAAGF